MNSLSILSRAGAILAAFAAFAALSIAACSTFGVDPIGDARAHILASLARTTEATRAKDIDGYMAELPDDLQIYDNDGRLVTREQQRQNVLRDWSIIVRTISLTHDIDRLEVNGDSATVWTSQRWERLMLRQDGQTTDNVVTTRKHREAWRRVGANWYGYDIEELEGELFINDVPVKR